MSCMWTEIDKITVLFICSLFMFAPFVCVFLCVFGPCFCCEVFCVLSSFAIVSLGRESE